MTWSVDGSLATGSDENTVRVWARDGQLLRTLTNHLGCVMSVAWSVDGRLAIGSDDGTVWVCAVHPHRPPSLGDVGGLVA